MLGGKEGTVMTDDEMVLHLKAKGYKITTPVDQSTCTHRHATAFGSVSSDGSSDLTYACPSCGKVWASKIGPCIVQVPWPQANNV